MWHFVVTDGIATSHISATRTQTERSRHEAIETHRHTDRHTHTHTQRDLLIMQRLSATLTCYAAAVDDRKSSHDRASGVDCAVVVINCRRNDDGKLDAIADWISSAWELWQTDWATLIHCKLPCNKRAWKQSIRMSPSSSCCCCRHFVTICATSKRLITRDILHTHFADLGLLLF